MKTFSQVVLSRTVAIRYSVNIATLINPAFENLLPFFASSAGKKTLLS